LKKDHTDHEGQNHEESVETDHKHGGLLGERSELIFSLACGALTAVGWGMERAGMGWPIVLFVAAYFFGSWFTFQEVLDALRARKLKIDSLMLLAAAGAAALGEWFEGALLLSLFTLGHSLESYAMSRARGSINALSQLVPDTALRLNNVGSEEIVPVSTLVRGERVLVKPHTRIPADGFVSAGIGSVDQAPITGESVPADKQPVADVEAALNALDTLDAQHRVFAGTINGASALTVVVTKAAGESTLARVMEMVATAESQRSPTQQFTDRFERIFVPIVILLVILLHFAWLVLDESFAQSFYRAMAVLVAASPCALAIATPSAVLSGVARAARGGVLVKGGAHLESLGLVHTIAFDKTGTLTEGKPKLTDIVTFSGVSEERLLSLAAAVERLSDHPLASAIGQGAQQRRPGLPILEASDVEAIIGFGVRATVAGQLVTIGKSNLFLQQGPLPHEVIEAVDTLNGVGRTVMIVGVDAQFLGVLGVMDTPRESAKRVVAALHKMGVKRTLMLSGDNQLVANAVAQQVGISEARGDLLPEDKVAAIKALASTLSCVAMVGDGVNDAPAMASATVGIAMGAAGSDVALETADIALMADELTALPFAVGLSRASRRIIQQNMWASLGMVAFLIPATVFDFAGIGVAVALHEGSTLIVVANALRLLAYKDERLLG
jgi:Cd2+/Zn2+-exporting ATPase